jgi:ankyrin repeat protein
MDSIAQIGWDTVCNDIIKIQTLLKSKNFDPTFNDNYPLKQSIKNNNIDVVKLLIEDKRIDISKIREEMIKIAENLAYIDILKLLKNDDNSELTEYYTKKFKEIAKLFPERIHFIKAFTIAIKSCTQIMVDLLIGCIQHKYTNKAILYACKSNYENIVILLLDDDSFDVVTGNNLLIHYSYNGNYRLVELLLKNKKIQPNYKSNRCIVDALKQRKLDIVKLLIKDSRLDLAMNKNFIFYMACKYGYLDIVKLLLKNKKVDPNDNDSDALITAFKYKQFHIVKYLALFPHVKFNSCNNFMFVKSVKLGYIDIVRLLLQRTDIDPCVNENGPLRTAFIHGDYKMLKLLLTNDSILNYPIQRLY